MSQEKRTVKKVLNEVSVVDISQECRLGIGLFEVDDCPEVFIFGVTVHGWNLDYYF